ncbi:MAG: polyprenyl synthetase family protein [Thermoplasmata archaeon]|nr:polyprenyl synthetase family protein [Thermoplasmata archaeon]
MMDIELYSSDDMKLVDDILNDNINCGVKIIEEVAHHVIDSGGKRIRPAVMLTAYKALDGKNIVEAAPLAASMELIHTGTLIHDDINDRSALRRGIPTAHMKFGTSAALLTGDYLFVKAFELLSEYGKELRDEITSACITLAIGEIIQAQNINNVSLTEQDYLSIIEQKTASPISASSRAGGLMAGGPDNYLSDLASYGLNLGIGFQIMDDILDVVGSKEDTGKIIGNDLNEGKMTILTIHALGNASQSENNFLKKVILNDRCTNDDIMEAIDIIRSAGSIDYAHELSMNYGGMARASLEELPRTADWDKLHLLADFAVDRNH